MPRAVAAALAALTSLALLAGCGSGEQKTPAGCLSAAPLARALKGSPGRALVGGAPISDCLTKNQAAGELAEVGRSMIGTAVTLNRDARRGPARRPAQELGFLVGAANRGASDTGGIHANLVARLTAAARFSPGGKPLPRGFEAAYRSGYAAGEDHG